MDILVVVDKIQLVKMKYILVFKKIEYKNKHKYNLYNNK